MSLRLHRARRHAGHAEPPQEGPALRARRAAAAARRPLRRGRRRAARRHRRDRRGRARLHGLRALRRAERPGAAGRHHLRPLLRRQRRAPRLLRRDHRHRRLEHRHGRPGDDRGRRARRVRARRDRPDGRAGPQRRRRHRGGRRGRGGRGRQAVPVVLPGPGRRRGSAPTSACCVRRSPRTGCASTTSAPSIETLADTGSVLELRRGFGLGMVTALARIEGRPIGIIANNPTAPRRRHRRRRRRQGRALHAAVRRLRPPGPVPVRHARDSWSGPRPRRRRWSATSAACSSSARNLTVPLFTIVLRKGYGLGAQAMAGGSFKAPLFTVAWPTGEFGGMGLEGAVRLGFRKELDAIDDPAEREAAVRGDGRPHRTSTARRSTPRPTSRSTTSSTPPTPAAGSSRRSRVPAPPPRDGKKRPCIDTW